MEKHEELSIFGGFFFFKEKNDASVLQKHKLLKNNFSSNFSKWSLKEIQTLQKVLDISTSVIWYFIFAIMIGYVKQLIKSTFLKTVLGNQASNVHAISNGTYAYSLGFSRVNNVSICQMF